MSSGLIVINLDRCTDRLAQVRTQLEARQLSFYRLAATDALAMTETERHRYYSEELNRTQYHKLLSPGEIACYASHLRACEYLLTTDWDYAVVLEDDVQLDERFCTALSQIPALTRPWDLIKLGAPSRKPIIEKTPLSDGFSLCAYAKTPICSHAQVISRSGAEKILKHRQPFGRPADVDLQFPWETSLAIYGIEPYTAFTDETLESEIWKISGRRAQKKNRIRFYVNRLSFTWHALRYNHHEYGLLRTLKTLFFGGQPHP